MGKFNRVVLLVAATLVALPIMPVGAADEPTVFSPSAEWATQSDGESCWIARQFGGAEDGVTFALQAFSPGATSYNAILRGKPLPHRKSGALEFEFRFNPDTNAIPATGVLSGGNIPRLTFSATLETADALEARRDGE